METPLVQLFGSGPFSARHCARNRSSPSSTDRHRRLERDQLHRAGRDTLSAKRWNRLHPSRAGEAALHLECAGQGGDRAHHRGHRSEEII